MSCTCSETSKVADSPVVPTTTRPEVLELMCHSIRSCNPSQFISPSDSIGVTRAVIEPFRLNINNFFNSMLESEYYRMFLKEEICQHLK